MTTPMPQRPDRTDSVTPEQWRVVVLSGFGLAISLAGDASLYAILPSSHAAAGVSAGAVGLLLFFGFIGACFRQRVGRPFKIMGIGALLAWCATSLFSGHFGTALEGRLIFIWLGTMLAMPALAPSGSESPGTSESSVPT